MATRIVDILFQLRQVLLHWTCMTEMNVLENVKKQGAYLVKRLSGAEAKTFLYI